MLLYEYRESFHFFAYSTFRHDLSVPAEIGGEPHIAAEG